MNNNEYQPIDPVPTTDSWTFQWSSKLACVLAALSTLCGIFTMFSSDICFRPCGFMITLFSLFIFLVEITICEKEFAIISALLVGIGGRFIARQDHWARALFYLVFTVLPYAICVPITGLKLTPPFGVTFVLSGAVNLMICVELLVAQLFRVPLNNEHLQYV